MARVRRWRIPALPALPFGAADGTALLAEDPSRLGVVLWDLARDVLAWAECTHAELRDFVAPGAERTRLAALASTPLDPYLARHLASIARILGDPLCLERDRMALSCSIVSEWADAAGALTTAAILAHAAATSYPGNASYSYQAGRLARRRADYARAEIWLSRAILLGHQRKDWESYGRGYLGLGNLSIQRGDYPTARRRHGKCLRIAERYRLHLLRCDALQDLCKIEIDTGNTELLNQRARQACEVFGPDHPRLPILAHDIAFAWMEQGDFAHALQVFDAVLPRYTTGFERVLLLADTCRAVAGLGDCERFEREWQGAWSFIGAMDTQDHLAQALLDLARGAATLRQWDRAETTALRALTLAAERREGRIQITAEGVLESVRAERSASRRRPAAAHQPRGVAFPLEQERLAADFVDSLSRCVGAA